MEHRDITDEIPEHDLKTDEEERVAPSSHKDHLNPTVQALKKKVESIEALVEDTQEQQTSATVPPPPPPTTIPSLVTPPSSVEIAKEKEAETSPTEILSEWKKSVQVQEDCSEERERLNRAREELEAKTREVDAGLEKMTSLETSVGAVKEMQTSQGQQLSVLQALIARIQQQAQESSVNTSWCCEQRERGRRGVGGVDTDIDAESEGEGGESDVGAGILDRGWSNKGQPGSSVSG
ncbi:hypothetical protein M378DRAFT_19194 [Amanita muscaria Koide BX008]|uniref:Uncharacterized protein n=1 Tax=Amanita muscaria (strain Koide BX008) TaxID=946122 RepID=A0A0C2WC14_AMAMK|nr:hypothetical protein M378DRAFT_19194 [Amanita muscaria Koide BX008]